MIALSMGLTRSELLDRLDVREYTELMALYESNPWGPDRDDMRTAQLCLQMHRTGFRGFRDPKLADFIPRFERRTPKRQATMQKARWLAWARQHNAAIQRK